MEDVYSGKVSADVTSRGVTIGSFAVAGNLAAFLKRGTGVPSLGIPNTSCARSIAVAHNKMAIKGMTVHMTEIGQSGANPYVTSDGWSQEVIIRIYAFCKVNEFGEPSDDAGTALPPIVTERISGSRFASSTTGISRVPPAGSFCKCIEIADPQGVGCVTELEAIAVTITPTNTDFDPAALAAGTVTNIAPYSPTARSISVTLYLESTAQDGVIFSPN